MTKKRLSDNENIKKHLADEFSKKLTSLTEEKINNKKKQGLPFYEKDVYSGIGISKVAFTFYKNGNDGKGINSKAKVPDLVGLYKIKNYFDVPYSFLLNETNTKDINNLELGMTLGLDDNSIKILNHLKNNDENIDKEFQLFIINRLISNEEYIKNLSNIVIGKLSRRLANEKFKKINLNHDENSDYMNYQKFKLSNITSGIIDEITNRDDIPIKMINNLKNKPRHIDNMKLKYLEEELKKKEEMENN